MRIGVMLRAYDRPGGIGIYCRNIIKHLLEIDQDNHYVLIYNNKENLGLYKDRHNVNEVYLPSVNPLVWDQLLTPLIIKKFRLDLIFNTKFSLPFLTKIKKIMVLHGASWFSHPELYGKFDIFYVRKAMPIYCRTADFLIANSDLTTNDFIEILNVPPEKIATTHLAAGDEFRVINDEKVLEEIQVKYQLPRRFILTVTSYDPRKNFATLLKAFELCRKNVDIDLVVIGKNCERYKEDFKLVDRGLEKMIHLPGWIEQKDLPAIYSLAEVFAFPSVIEEFGIPVVEAMSCGCPVVASNTGAIPELTKDAALLSDPFDHVAFSENLLKILSSDAEANYYRHKGLERAKQFSWSKAAKKTLKIFQRIKSLS